MLRTFVLQVCIDYRWMGYHQSGQETLSSVCRLQSSHVHVAGVKVAMSRNCRAQKWSLIILTVKTPQIINLFIQGNTTLYLTYAAKSYLRVMLRLYTPTLCPEMILKNRKLSMGPLIRHVLCDYVRLEDDQYLLCRMWFDYFLDPENNMSHPLLDLCKCVYFTQI